MHEMVNRREKTIVKEIIVDNVEPRMRETTMQVPSLIQIHAPAYRIFNTSGSDKAKRLCEATTIATSQ